MIERMDREKDMKMTQFSDKPKKGLKLKEA